MDKNYTNVIFLILVLGCQAFKPMPPQNLEITGDKAKVRTESTQYSMDSETRKTVTNIVSKVIWGSGILIIIFVLILIIVLKVVYTSIPASAVSKIFRSP